MDGAPGEDAPTGEDDMTVLIDMHRLGPAPTWERE
ncbi:hypothetical protein SAMN05216207_102374 [Pseudonocardia ammonioxydans]|uniref:Uncharacterized protein n=1 Tax=Pseudonocardia ammonioxydans TaxID=260086 RepID=A0A1I5CM09_PSUAM|nr:hypothetical protein SAMN05216207_102374 [Pseudonocardia ammonioxydans]